jgi:hypothetical protein
VLYDKRKSARQSLTSLRLVLHLRDARQTKTEPCKTENAMWEFSALAGNKKIKAAQWIFRPKLGFICSFLLILR